MRGAGDVKKRRAIFDKHRINGDIIILQETHSSKEVEKIWEHEWGGKIIFSHGTTAARGVALLTNQSIYDQITNIYTDQDGRIIICDLYQNGITVTITAVYAPNHDSPEFFKQVQGELRKRQEHKILIGDFNLTLDVELDRQNTYNNNNRAKEEVLNMCDEFKVRDIWRILYENKREYSWIKKGSYPTKASRIDFTLISGGLDQKVEDIQYISSIYTDHRAVYVVLKLEPLERGSGYWKFNNTVLQDKEFLDLIRMEIMLTSTAASHKDPQTKWELIKKKIKDKSIEFSKNKAKENGVIISNLSEKLNEYESRLPLTLEENRIMEDTRADLEEKTLERIKGVMFRSKAKWYEEGERSTKYFYALERARYNAKTCYTIIDENGLEINTVEGILEEQEKFYSKLYEEDKDVEFRMTNSYGIEVPEEVRKDQEDQLTEIDIQEAIKGMNNNKTPGQDGLPIDFYKVFWTSIKEPFMEMVLYSYQMKNLHSSARKGILNLIPKAEKDTRYIKNLRPITLLNTDYKIIEKAIANKMVPALEHLIHRDQRGFMKNRRISVNIRKMLDIMHLAEKEDLEAVILSLDFVKCFDKCSFSILHGSLEFFKFGNIVKEWTKILYKDFTVKIQNNGHFSRDIRILKGVHQGGCASAIYFLVIAEILAILLRNNEEIEGITWETIRNLLNQFADDMDIFSVNKEKSLKAILEELDRFKLQSGFTVSYDKTTLYRIGSLRTLQC